MILNLVFIAEINPENASHLPQVKLEKKFGQSPVFVASTMLENGGVPKDASSASLLKEAIHVISCGYEDKTEWGREASSYINLYNPEKLSTRNFAFITFLFAHPGWLDIWFGHRRYLDRIQDALSWLAVCVLYT